MAFSGHNQTIYNAALNGCLAGQLAGRPLTDPTTGDYAGFGAVATAFATEVDSLIGADAQLTTAGATLVPASAANQQNFNAKQSAIFSLSFGYWYSRPGGDVNAGDYAVAAAAVVAAYNQAIAQYALAPGGTSLS